MSSHIKASKLYKYSTIEISDTDIEGLAINLEAGH